MTQVGPNYPGIPAECPTCASHGMHSAVKLYQVNMEEAAVFCENSSVSIYIYDTCVQFINIFYYFFH